MDDPINASYELTPDIEPPIMLPTVSLEVMDDSSNANAKDPLPT
jgi:hypothetical protein